MVAVKEGKTQPRQLPDKKSWILEKQVLERKNYIKGIRGNTRLLAKERIRLKTETEVDIPVGKSNCCLFF